MGRDQPAHAPVVLNNEAAMSRGQQVLVHKGLQIHATVNDGSVAGHDITDSNAAKAFGDFHLHVASPRCLQ